MDLQGKWETSHSRTALELSVCALHTKRPSLSSCGAWFSLTTDKAALHLVGPGLRVRSVLDDFMVHTMLALLKCSCPLALVSYLWDSIQSTKALGFL